MSNSYIIKKLLQNDGWKENVLIQCDSKGKISSIEENSSELSAKTIHGFALPGFQNGHSHAFQYAMAGLAEVHDISHTSDDFW